MSNCSCIYIDSFDYSSFYREELPTARKMHMCSECGRDINKGENYKKEVGLWQDGFVTFKTCIDCLSIRDEFFCGGWNFGSVLVDLEEYIKEAHGKISEDCIINLTDNARYKVFDMIEEGWQNDNQR